MLLILLTKEMVICVTNIVFCIVFHIVFLILALTKVSLFASFYSEWDIQCEIKTGQENNYCRFLLEDNILCRFTFAPYVMMSAPRSPPKVHLAPTGFSQQTQRKGGQVTVRLVRVENCLLAGEQPQSGEVSPLKERKYQNKKKFNIYQKDGE